MRNADKTKKELTGELNLKSERYIRTILDTVDEGFIVVDKNYRIETANRAYCSQIGMTRDEVIHKHCYEVSHKAKRPCHEEGEECAVHYVFTTGKPYAAVHRHRDPSGSLLFMETKAFPIKDASGSVISVIETVNNITEKHLLEEVRLKTQKLEAIGTLAGGIAHDFNNLLQAVFGYISLAKMEVDGQGWPISMLNQAEHALNLCANLTKQLLTFSKGGMPEKKPLSLADIIENSVKFSLSGSRIGYRTMIDPDLRIVEADEGQISQVIQNIVINAEQAMPRGGTVIISAKNVRLPRKGKFRLLEEGNYVEIAIEDSGVGISDQNLSKIFDPYFTTKEGGSGLGLATAYSIVKNHEGIINVRSQAGKGSAFFVYLPALDAGALPARRQDQAAPIPRPAKILLMDDEDLIREIAGQMMNVDGHQVEFAEHGEAAIEKYRSARNSGLPFDMVILDLTIRGGMGGRETVERLLEIDPALKAIVSSGYSDDAVIAAYGKHGFAASLTKPYKIAELRNVISSVLAKPL